MNLDTFSIADVADMIEDTVYNVVSTVMHLFSFIFSFFVCTLVRHSY